VYSIIIRPFTRYNNGMQFCSSNDLKKGEEQEKYSDLDKAKTIFK
jgi:hypothetical protein